MGGQKKLKGRGIAWSLSVSSGQNLWLRSGVWRAGLRILWKDPPHRAVIGCPGACECLSRSLRRRAVSLASFPRVGEAPAPQELGEPSARRC